MTRQQALRLPTEEEIIEICGRGENQIGGVDPQQVDYVAAHGTGTKENDSIETRAIKSLFGEHAGRLAISSVKSMMGHLIAAAGAVQLIACVLAIRDQKVPPTAEAPRLRLANRERPMTAHW